MANNSKSNQENIVLSLLNILIEKSPEEYSTKESIVEAYNYIFDNLHTSTPSVTIVDDIQ